MKVYELRRVGDHVVSRSVTVDLLHLLGEDLCDPYDPASDLASDPSLHQMLSACYSHRVL